VLPNKARQPTHSRSRARNSNPRNKNSCKRNKHTIAQSAPFLPQFTFCSALINSATFNAVISPGSGAPNRLLFYVLPGHEPDRQQRPVCAPAFRLAAERAGPERVESLYGSDHAVHHPATTFPIRPKRSASPASE